MDKDTPPQESMPRGIYLLPNLLTTGALFAGFYGIVAGMNGYFDLAAMSIFIAMILDTLDGRVARLTNTQSEFGAQYDSISDIVCFGVAPALIAYKWGLDELGKPGWLAAFFYTAATALRLARFNANLHVNDKRFFQGLPCPSAAALVVGTVWVAYEYGIPGQKLWSLAACVTLIAAFLQVSSIPYYSFKDIDIKGKVPFLAVLVILIIYICISIDPPKVLLGFFALYAFSGPIWSIKCSIRRFFERQRAKKLARKGD